MFKTFFWAQQNLGGRLKRFGGNCRRMPHRVCGPVQNRRQKVFHWGLVCAGGLDILKFIFNSQHEHQLQIVQIKYKYFPANTHNGLVVSN